ncbi:unnamed protein product, partial [marine sediment metagenome]
KGVGSKGKIRLSKNQLMQLLKEGVDWAIRNGYGWEEDKYFIEENGCMAGVNTDFVGDFYERIIDLEVPANKKRAKIQKK